MLKFRKSFTLIFMLVLSLLLLTACDSTKTDTSTDVKEDAKSSKVEIKSITYDEIKDKEFQIIDIRDEEYYLGWENSDGISGHIKDAIDFPETWFDILENSSNIDIELERRHIDKTKDTVIYSDNDITKEQASYYIDAGFEKIYSLEGGIKKYSEDKNELEKLEGYNMYVSPSWVQDLIDGKNPSGYNGEKYKIIEISIPPETDEYKDGHIPTAINLKSDDINHIVGPREVAGYENIPIEEQQEIWGLPKDDDIKKVLEEAGIDKDTMVILYGTEAGTTAATRAAFVMDYAGVENIKFINGGKPNWILEGKDLEKTENKSEKVDFGTTIPQKPEIEFTYEDEMKFVKDKNAVIASVRSWDEYICKISGYTYIAEVGDIENSRFAYAGSDPYAMEDFRNPDNTMFNYKIVKERWDRWGITSDKTISFHCGTGWRACETYYIAEAMGYENIGVYIGGWFQWTKYPDSPVKEKGLPKDAPEQEPEEYFIKK